jgi:sensor histidine kinase YesM
MSPAALPAESWPAALARGFRARPMIVFLIAAMNTAIALLVWVEDPRPFWHPFVSVQLSGFAVAYCVNVAAPWNKRHPIPRLALAVAVGSLVALALIVIVKQYDLAHLTEKWRAFVGNFFASFFVGLFVSLFFYVRERDARATAALHRSEAERNLLARQAVEAELKLMQAQVEPHFLYNTLASVQYLTETDPPQASKLLGHLIDYLRMALPDLRAGSTTLRREFALARAYLEILAMRMGSRLTWRADLPDALADLPFPPNMLISLVENAIKHGVEPSADGGTVTIVARREGARLVLSVEDTGRGLAAASGSATAGQGVGLGNVRERLAALFGTRGTFAIESIAPRGTRAIIEVPCDV